MNSWWQILTACLLIPLEIYGKPNENTNEIPTILRIPYQIKYADNDKLSDLKFCDVELKQVLYIKANIDADNSEDLRLDISGNTEKITEADDSVDEDIYGKGFAFFVMRGRSVKGEVAYDKSQYIVGSHVKSSTITVKKKGKATSTFKIIIHMDQVREVVDGVETDPLKLKTDGWLLQLPSLRFEFLYRVGTFKSTGLLKKWNITFDKGDLKTLEFVCSPWQSVQLAFNEAGSELSYSPVDGKDNKAVAFVVRKANKYMMLKGNTKMFFKAKKFCTLYVNSKDYEIQFPFWGKKHVNIAKRRTNPRLGYRLYKTDFKLLTEVGKV